MNRIRSFLFWCHLVTGVCVGAVVLIMSATGVLLTYQRQLVSWAERRDIARTAPAAASALPLDTLLSRTRAAVSGSNPTSLTWRADAPRVVEITVGRDSVLYLDGFSGELLGRSDQRLRAFFARVTAWHRWLGASANDAAARARGKLLTGVSNVGFLFLVLSGFWLWWPRNWTPAAVRSVTLFRSGLGGKARDFNWHNVIGFWSLVPLFVVVASGVVISYPWASNLVYRAFGEQPPAGGARPGGAGGGAGASAPALPSGIDAMLGSAGRKVDGWRSITLTLPRAATGPVTFAIDRGTGGQPQKRATLTLDAATGAERKWEPFASQSAGRRARAVLRFAHTGEVLGVLGQTIAGLVSLGAVLMVWTGISLSLRRLSAWRTRRERVEQRRMAA